MTRALVKSYFGSNLTTTMESTNFLFDGLNLGPLTSIHLLMKKEAQKSHPPPFSIEIDCLLDWINSYNITKKTKTKPGTPFTSPKSTSTKPLFAHWFNSPSSALLGSFFSATHSLTHPLSFNLSSISVFFRSCYTFVTAS